MSLRQLTIGVLLAGVACVAGIASFALTPDKPTAPKPNAKVTPTFSKHIAPILYKNCSTCHRSGEVAPFSLMNYQDAKKRAKQIALVTQSGFMPPWKADANYGEHEGVRVLTAEQKDLLQRWSEAGAPEGVSSQTPKPPKFSSDWALGTPDSLVEPSESYEIGAEGTDDYRNFVIPTSYNEDRYVSGVEVRPGNRAVVHHVLIYLDTKGRARKLDEKDPGIGYTTFGGIGFSPSGGLGGWAPGNQPRKMPENVGIMLPKGSDIILQVHYHKTGKVEKDRTKIALYFSKKPVDKQARVLPVVSPMLRIPANEANYSVRAAMPILENITILDVTPHMHLLGKEMKVWAETEDKTEKPLVKISDWDFGWQTTYNLKKPMQLAEGSKLRLTARYDNTSNNPRNPNSPPKITTWGEGTNDEMCIAFVTYTVDEEHLLQGKAGEDLFTGFGENSQGFMRRLTKKFDRNKNGKLEKEERDAFNTAIREFFGG